jgi:hypothetical protein
MTRTVTVVGVVKEFHWMNPHSYLVLGTADEHGKPADAFIETNGPGYLVGYGWKRESITPGDRVTAKIHPLRDGKPGGSLVSITLPDGRELRAEGPTPEAPEHGGKDVK